MACFLVLCSGPVTFYAHHHVWIDGSQQGAVEPATKAVSIGLIQSRGVATGTVPTRLLGHLLTKVDDQTAKAASSLEYILSV
jgi:hypothetical protein